MLLVGGKFSEIIGTFISCLGVPFRSIFDGCRSYLLYELLYNQYPLSLNKTTARKTQHKTKVRRQKKHERNMLWEHRFGRCSGN